MLVRTGTSRRDMVLSGSVTLVGNLRGDLGRAMRSGGNIEHGETLSREDDQHAGPIASYAGYVPALQQIAELVGNPRSDVA